MKEKILLIWKHLKQGTLKKMWKQTLWIYQYGRRYWKAMILYTLLGLVGTGVSLVSSLISRDLVDIVTGHQTGKLISTFAAMIGFSVANILVSQASGYASTFINLKVDSEIKNDIFAKMLVTDWESLTDYHTGDLVTRWSSDASNISSGILNWIPNLIIYTFRFISALAIVLYYDPTFALFALLGIPFSALLSKPLLKRMRDNNQRSAAMNHNGTAVFANASIEAYPHEIVALVGPSGEGKTTMLRLILSLLTPQEGSSHICAGTDHEHMIDKKCEILNDMEIHEMIQTF